MAQPSESSRFRDTSHPSIPPAHSFSTHFPTGRAETEDFIPLETHHPPLPKGANRFGNASWTSIPLSPQLRSDSAFHSRDRAQLKINVPQPLSFDHEPRSGQHNLRFGNGLPSSSTVSSMSGSFSAVGSSGTRGSSILPYRKAVPARDTSLAATHVTTSKATTAAHSQSSGGWVPQRPPRNIPPHIHKSYESMREQNRHRIPPAVKVPNPGRKLGHPRALNISRGRIHPAELEADSSFPPAVSSGLLSRDSSTHPRSANSKYSTNAKVQPSFRNPESITSNKTLESIRNGSFIPRHLTRIESEMYKGCEAAVKESRSSIFTQLTPKPFIPFPTNRVALTGPMGTGKTYLAIALVERLVRESPRTPIFWIAADSEDQIKVDCCAVADLLELERPQSNEKPWDSIGNLLRALADGIVSPWVAVLDGLEDLDHASHLRTLFDVDFGRHSYIVATTRYNDLAEALLEDTKFAIGMGHLDSLYAANLLGRGAVEPTAGIFDCIAHALNFDALAITRAKIFLNGTSIPPQEYMKQLTTILDSNSWARSGLAAIIAGGIFTHLRLRTRCKRISLHGMSELSLPAVLHSCSDPSWSRVFERLHIRHRAASNLLSILSIIGRTEIPLVIFSQAFDLEAVGQLINESVLVSHGNTLIAGMMMLISHRIWLAARNALQAAHDAALCMIAREYPDANFAIDRQKCEALEPFAQVMLSDAAQSWLSENSSLRFHRLDLIRKRAQYLRLSSPDTLDRIEMEEAEDAELAVLRDSRKRSGTS